MTILSLGLVRGIFAQIVGTILGMLLVALGRELTGLPWWNPEASQVVGGMLGTVSFLIGASSFRD